MGDENRNGSAGSSSSSNNAAVNAISVVVRIRPANSQELECAQSTQIVKALDSHVVVFDPLDAFGRERDNYRPGVPGHRKAKDLRYAFDRVFGPTAMQPEVYAGTTQPLLEALLEGYNCSVFAYGATGAGKTHTMLGYHNDPGVMVLTMKELFERIETTRQDRTIQVSVSMMEIYNETLRDLLIPGGQRSGQLDVREDADGSVAVPGLSEHEPKDAREVLDLLALGNSNRTVSSTNVNATSSRSHAVLQIRMRQRDRATGVAATIRTSKLSMIDLAGSERASATKNSGERLVEGANINKSLLALGNCINALGDPTKKGGFVPYRDSKLTRLLKDSLGGNCRTVMIANVSPSAIHYEDTHNTLKYANRAKEIKMKLDKNIVSVDYHINAYTTVIRELQEQVTTLKEQLNRRPAVSNGDNTSFGEAFQRLQKQLSDLTSVYENLVTQHANLWSQMHQLLWAHELNSLGMPATNGVAAAGALQQLHAVEQQLAQHEALMEQWLNEQAPSLTPTEVELCRLQLVSKVHFSRRQAIEGQLTLTLAHCDRITGFATDLSQRFRHVSGALQQQPREVLSLCNIDASLMRWPAQSQQPSRTNSPRKQDTVVSDVRTEDIVTMPTLPIAPVIVAMPAAASLPQHHAVASPKKMLSRHNQPQRHSPYARRVAIPLAPEALAAPLPAVAPSTDVEVGRHVLRNTAARRRSMLPVLSADAKRRESVSISRVPLSDLENLSRDGAKFKGKSEAARQARRGSLLPQPVWN